MTERFKPNILVLGISGAWPNQWTGTMLFDHVENLGEYQEHLLTQHDDFKWGGPMTWGYLLEGIHMSVTRESDDD